jgi:hypothetical protein
VQSIRDVPYLDHLGHANSISHVPHMRNHHDWLLGELLWVTA